MGYTTEMGFTDLNISKEKRLEIHLQGNFYQRHPKEVEDSTIKGFLKYWNYDIGLKELARYCYLKDVNGLNDYYSTFLNNEDLED